MGIKDAIARDATGEQRLTLEAAAIVQLQALNARLFQAPDVESVLIETMNAACTLLDTQMGSTFMYHPESQAMEHVADRGLSPLFAAQFKTVRVGDSSACAMAFERREPVVIPDTWAEPACAPMASLLRALEIRGVVAAPLLNHDGEVMALVSVYFPKPHLASAAELRIFDLLISQATHLLERFQSVEALRRSQQQFAALFEQAACGIARVDLDGRLTMVNDRYCQILGRPREELLGERILDFTHPDDVPRNAELMDGAIQDARSYAMEKRYVRPNGTAVWTTVDVSTICDAHGKPVEVMGICQDISARKATEDALREADHRKDEFLATLAHELRNPLAPICNGLELLTGEGKDPEFFDDIHATLTRQAQHMVRLVDDLLDVSRITRGKIDLRKSRVDVASIIHNASETAEPIINESGHRLALSLPDKPLIIDADASRLSQVVCNLLNNAAKYMQPGGEIALTADTADGDVLIRVRDSGIGIEPELLDKIFGLFTQVDRSMERSQSGLGVGLTIVKRLVEMHGGSVFARSDGLGRGSEFTVRLPLAADQTLDDREADRAQHEPSRPKRVLVVDDNASVRKALVLLLESLGHEAHAAADGVEALAAAEALRPDVVLLDLAMPRLNGFDAARGIRKQPWGRKMVLVALTGWGLEEHRRTTREAGFDHHFVKPVDGRALQALLSD
jgi:PAS domain S-box-containing protein